MKNVAVNVVVGSELHTVPEDIIASWCATWLSVRVFGSGKKRRQKLTKIEAPLYQEQGVGKRQGTQ